MSARLPQQARDAETVFRDTLHRLAPDVSATHRFVEEEVGWAMARESLVADIAIPAHPAEAIPAPAPMARTAEYVLLNSGRPVLILPPGTRLKPGGHVAIAWDGRREAARAVADAMPLLAAAAYVSVITICSDPANAPDSGATALLAWLERHGIKAELRMERGGDVGEILLFLVGAMQVDLLVAGYGHSRARELVMGGTTRMLLATSPVPLLLSH